MILVHPAAAAEARDARVRYARSDPAVGARFEREYDRVIEQIRAYPHRWPRYPHLEGTFHWCRFRRFPYAMIDELLPDVTHILAVAADRRSPGYWAART